jgi:outer membrane lipoprotein-sorting protein
MGCVTIKRRHEVKKEEIRPQLDSSEEKLLSSYNAQAKAVQSIEATVDLVPTTGTTFSGVIEEYHDVPGFILAQRPASIRVIGQAPLVAKNIFDMVSDGKEFKIYIPSKNSFLVGSTSLARPSDKPLENLRPQHIVEALFWPEFPPNANVLFEQFDTDTGRYYILTQLRTRSTGKLEIARKIWYDRSDLRVSRLQLLGADGRLDSDIQYSDWQPVALPADAAETSPTSGISYPREVHIWRPQDDYKLEIRISKMALNESISVDRFELAQPDGTDLLRVGEEKPETPASAQSGPRVGSKTASGMVPRK